MMFRSIKISLTSAATDDTNVILVFTNSVDPDETAHYEPSHQDLRCLAFSLTTLHINFFPTDSLFKKTTTENKADDNVV